MTRFTKELRQQIVEKFARRHNGQFNAALFLDEVRATGASHEAYDWFEWDETKAAMAYQLEQARSFARDLRVVFRIEEVVRKNSVRIRETSMPLVISPMDGRKDGGGYVLVDTNSDEHHLEHCRQAASALHAWLNRYESALAYAGISKAKILEVEALLENARPAKAAV